MPSGIDFAAFFKICHLQTTHTLLFEVHQIDKRAACQIENSVCLKMTYLII